MLHLTRVMVMRFFVTNKFRSNCGLPVHLVFGFVDAKVVDMRRLTLSDLESKEVVTCLV